MVMTLQIPRPDFIFTFGYGSNMFLSRMRCRVPSACPLCVAELREHRFAFCKVSKYRGRSGKGDATWTGNPEHRVIGVVFEALRSQIHWLDDAEGLNNGYECSSPLVREVNGDRTFYARTYLAADGNVDETLFPFDWYKRHVVEGARRFGIDRLDPGYFRFIEQHPVWEDSAVDRVRQETGYPDEGDVADDDWNRMGCNGPGPEPCC
jgi:hypothetical protein